MNPRGYRLLLCCLSGLLFWITAQADPQIRILALFPGKALVSVDGSSHLLTLEQRGPSGMRLISASSKEAVIELGGLRKSYRLGDHIGSSYAKPASSEARILRNPQGAFVSAGTINGRSVQMMVDTGATVVAINSSDAERLGIDYRKSGRSTLVSTASGTVQAYALKLDRVQVGAIEQRGIDAVVIEGVHPAMVLLGQTFLKGVKIEDRGNLMILHRLR